MGIDPASLTERQLQLMAKADRQKLGRRGVTAAEALQMETTRLERQIHNQFSSFCLRHEIDVWHSNPTRRSTIGAGLPDFLCVKNSRAIAIEFKIRGNKLSPVQEGRFTELRGHGNEVHVCEEMSSGAAYTEAIRILKEFFHLN